MFYRVLVPVLWLMAFTCQADPWNLNELLEKDGGRVVRLPVGQLFWVEKDGKRFMISGSGRYLIKGGELWDVWTDRRLETSDEVHSSTVIDFSLPQFDPATLSTFTLNRGKPRLLTLIVDPTCNYCARIVQDAAALSEVETRIIVVPVLGGQSGEAVRRIWCGSDKERALSALQSGRWQDLPAVDPGKCDYDAVRRAMTLMQANGVSTVPYLIRDDGVAATGYPTNLHQWMEQR